MSDQKPERAEQPTGEMIDGYLLTSNGGDACADEAEIEKVRVFIPRAWRGQLGMEDSE